MKTSLLQELENVNDSIIKLEKIVKRTIENSFDPQNDFENQIILSLNESIKNLKNPEVNIPLIGSVNVGKSTLVSAILCKSSERSLSQVDPVHIDNREATAVPVIISYGPSYKTFVIKKDNSTPPKIEKKEISHDEFLGYKVIQDSIEHNRKFLGVAALYVEYPNDLLKLGIVLEDLPGLNKSEERTTISQKTINDRALGIFVFNKNFTVNDEVAKIYKSFRTNTGGVSKNWRLITVFNDFGFDGEIQSKYDVYSKLYQLVTETEHSAEIEKIEDLENELKKHIFIVDAEAAKQGKWTKNSFEVRSSGIGDLEAELAKLVGGEMRVQLKENFLKRIIELLDTGIKNIQDKITNNEEKIAGAKVTVAEVEILKGELLEKYIKTRGLFTNYCDKTIEEVSLSYERMIDDLVNIEIPSCIESFNDTLEISLKLERKIEELIPKIIDTWEKNESASIIFTNVNNLRIDLGALRAFSDNDLKMTTNKNAQLEESISGMERVLSGVGGFFAGGFVSAGMGAAFGVEGAVSTGIYGFSTAVLVSSIGFPVLTAGLIVLLAQLLVAAKNIEHIKASLKSKITLKSKKKILEIKKNGLLEIEKIIKDLYFRAEQTTSKYYYDKLKSLQGSSFKITFEEFDLMQKTIEESLNAGENNELKKQSYFQSIFGRSDIEKNEINHQSNLEKVNEKLDTKCREIMESKHLIEPFFS